LTTTAVTVGRSATAFVACSINCQLEMSSRFLPRMGATTLVRGTRTDPPYVSDTLIDR
jgi:hypothetical protein